MQSQGALVDYENGDSMQGRGKQPVVTTGRQCKAINKQGQPCGAFALARSNYCFHHDPTKAAERKAARSKGGHGMGETSTAPSTPSR